MNYRDFIERLFGIVETVPCFGTVGYGRTGEFPNLLKYNLHTLQVVMGEKYLLI